MTNLPEIIFQTLEEMIADFLKSLPDVLAALAILILSLYLASLVRRVVRKGLIRRSTQAQPIDLLTQMAYWAVILLGTITALQHVGINLSAFLAGVGIAGIVVGFALQDVSKNFIAGILMLLQQPFRTGDVIEVTEFTGTVLTIDLRATHLRTLDGSLVLIPNGDVYTNPITNYTQVTSRRVEIGMSVANDSDPETVRRIAIDALHAVPGLSEDPNIEVYFQNLGGSTLDLTAYFWIDASQTTPGLAKDAGLASIKKAFQAEMIELPIPSQAIYVKQ
jgi:small conductance mechanosensitive channel